MNIVLTSGIRHINNGMTVVSAKRGCQVTRYGNLCNNSATLADQLQATTDQRLTFMEGAINPRQITHRFMYLVNSDNAALTAVCCQIDDQHGNRVICPEVLSALSTDLGGCPGEDDIVRYSDHDSRSQDLKIVTRLVGKN